MRIKLPFFATFHLDTEHVNTAGCSRPRLSPSILRCNPPLSWPPAQASQETRRVRDCCRLHLGPGDQLSRQKSVLASLSTLVCSRDTGHSHYTQHQPSAISLVPRPVAGGGWPAWLFMSCSLTPALAPLLCKPSHFPPTWPCSKNHPLWAKNLTQQKQERHQHQFDYPEGILIARYQTAMSAAGCWLGAGPCPWSKVIICLRFKIPFIKFFCVYSQNLFGLFLHSA